MSCVLCWEAVPWPGRTGRGVGGAGALGAASVELRGPGKGRWAGRDGGRREGSGIPVWDWDSRELDHQGWWAS